MSKDQRPVTRDIPTLQKFDALKGKTLLICVGAMKCATSWLFNYLEPLPGMAVSPLKEVHFFDSRFSANALSNWDRLNLNRVAAFLAQDGDILTNLHEDPAFQASLDRVRMIYDDNAYFAHFARLAAEDVQTLADITPAYSTIGPDGFRYLHDVCATQDIRLRLLFIMRDPVDRFWSQLRHMTQANPKMDVAGRWADAIQSPKIMAWTDYRHTVMDMDDIFPAEDLLYLFYEDLFTETALRQLCLFAGVSYLPGEPDVRQHETELQRDLPVDARAAFLETFAPQYAFCRERFGDRVPASWLA